MDGGGWRGRKERDLEAMRSKAFWESPDRFAVLARIEYVDRVEAALRTAEKLSGRLARSGRNGHGAATNLVQLLAQRLYLLDRACTDLTHGDPTDAFLEIRAQALDLPEADFPLRLREMYEAWGAGEDARSAPAIRYRPSARDRGIGAYRILSAETGLHVFEVGQPDGSFSRHAVRVAVAPCPAAAPDTDPVVLARRVLAASPSPTTDRAPLPNGAVSARPGFRTSLAHRTPRSGAGRRLRRDHREVRCPGD